jgi:hypothetical protein
MQPDLTARDESLVLKRNGWQVRVSEAAEEGAALKGHGWKVRASALTAEKAEERIRLYTLRKNSSL